MNNAELIVRMLEAGGVRWVFGIPSGPVLPLIDALRTSSISFVLTASETSAGFMASTVGMLTGVPGICVSTVGPGATNLTTGVGAAWLDRAPVIAITCNVATPWLERRTQMRIDHHQLFAPLTKASLPLRHGQVAGPLAQALDLALQEPPGPVHLDLPEDVAAAPAIEALRGELVEPRRPSTSLGRTGSSEAVEAVRAALERTRHPLVVTGLSFTRSRASAALLRFIETQKLPFVTTLHSKGFLPESHPNWAGVIGRARRTDVRRFTDRADLIIAIGYDPIEINYEEWIGDAHFVHLSTEPADVGPSVPLLHDGVGDLDVLVEAIAQLRAFPNEWSPADWADHRARFEAALRPPVQGFAPHDALDILRKQLPKDAILAYDVGAHTHQIASQWRTDLPFTCLASNGWSSMGYGMPAAYAAKLVQPDRTVVGVVGDGGFQMTAGELALARRLGLAVPIVVLNDGWLGLMKVKQERKGYALSGVRLGDPPESPAHYFGVACRSAQDSESFAAALDWALSLNGASIIEAFVDAEAYSHTVYD